jgi:hypothetical protein
MIAAHRPTHALQNSGCAVNNDQLKVELVEPDRMPHMVRITWPLQPTVIDPPRFGDTAAALVKLFSEARVALAAIRARRRL